jgi:hypothetical protein
MFLAKEFGATGETSGRTPVTVVFLVLEFALIVRGGLSWGFSTRAFRFRQLRHFNVPRAPKRLFPGNPLRGLWLTCVAAGGVLGGH